MKARSWLSLFVVLTGAVAAAPAGASSPLPDREAQGRPFADGPRFQIRLGERAVVEFDGQMRPLILSIEPIDESALRPPPGKLPEGPLVISFTGNDTGTLLTLENGFAAQIDYRAEILRPSRDGPRFAPTTTCTLPANLTMYESWPEPRLAVMVLGPFQRKVGDIVCGTKPD